MLSVFPFHKKTQVCNKATLKKYLYIYISLTKHNPCVCKILALNSNVPDQQQVIHVTVAEEKKEM